jgi:Glycyl-tRNA synthetase beta subunit
MGEYLLEVRSEEIPARMLEPGVRELATRVFEELMARGIGPREVETGYTPRRLVLILSGLPEREPDREEQVMGPPVRAAYAPDGSPTPALTGFAKRTGVEPDQLARVQTDKGEYLAATKKTEGRATREILAEIVPRILAGISWAKTMRWGSGEGPWVRPVRHRGRGPDGRPPHAVARAVRSQRRRELPPGAGGALDRGPARRAPPRAPGDHAQPGRGAGRPARPGRSAARKAGLPV